MKTNRKKRKLVLEKHQIAKINDLHAIKGGGIVTLVQDLTRSFRPTCTCP